METWEPRHGAGKSEEQIDQMERGVLMGRDVVVTVELGEEEIDRMERGEPRGRDVVVAEEVRCSNGVFAAVRHALIGAGARAAFYPTLLCNVVRNKLDPNRRWWDNVDED